MEQTFHRNPWKALLLLLGSLTFVVVAVLLLQVEHDPDKRLRATAVIAFFGLCAVVGVIQLLPNSGYLRLTEQGFIVKSLFRSRLYRWSDVEYFGVIEVTLRRSVFKVLQTKQKFVGFNFSPEYAGTPPRIRLVEYDAVLPDNYGHDHQHLADILNQWKQRSTSA